MKDLKTLAAFILFLYKNRGRNLWRTHIAMEWKKDPARVSRLVKLALENNLIMIHGHVIKLSTFGERMGELLREVMRRTGIDPTRGEEAIMALRQAVLDRVWHACKWLPAPPPNMPVPIWMVEGTTPPEILLLQKWLEENWWWLAVTGGSLPLIAVGGVIAGHELSRAG